MSLQICELTETASSCPVISASVSITADNPTLSFTLPTGASTKPAILPYYFWIVTSTSALRSTFGFQDKLRSPLFNIVEKNPGTDGYASQRALWNTASGNAATAPITMLAASCSNPACPTDCATSGTCTAACNLCTSNPDFTTKLEAKVECKECYARVTAYIGVFTAYFSVTPLSLKLNMKGNVNAFLNLDVTGSFNYDATKVAGDKWDVLLAERAVPSFGYKFDLLTYEFSFGLFYGVQYQYDTAISIMGKFNTGLDATILASALLSYGGSGSGTGRDTVLPSNGITYTSTYKEHPSSVQLSGSVTVAFTVRPFIKAQVVLGSDSNKVYVALYLQPKVIAGMTFAYPPMAANTNLPQAALSFSYPENACAKSHLIEYSVNAEFSMYIEASAKLSLVSFDTGILQYPLVSIKKLLINGCMGMVDLTDVKNKATAVAMSIGKLTIPKGMVTTGAAFKQWARFYLALRIVKGLADVRNINVHSIILTMHQRVFVSYAHYALDNICSVNVHFAGFSCSFTFSRCLLYCLCAGL
jgi:hypothetical protein